MKKARQAKFLPIERFYKRRGFHVIAGLDEAGRGPLAGPVICAAVILKKNVKLPGLNDSKLLTQKKKLELYEKIVKTCDYGIGIASAKVIDAKGLIKACEMAFTRAYRKLKNRPDLLLVDGNDHFRFSVPFQSIIRGDRKVRSIAAASVLSKVHRDRLMVKLSRKFPDYAFDIHKGYGTKLHKTLLKRFGPSPAHRMRFRPVFEIANSQKL